MPAVIHIAGAPVQIGSHVRQRCSWCGAVLIDQDLSRVAVAIDPASDPRGDEEATRFPTWPVGELIEVHQGIGTTGCWTVDHVDGEPLPDGCCGKLDPAVTV